ncbi:hypothetical protein SAMN05444349_1148 [Bacteroides faecichinchillae]|uniref:Lipoprotein n=1 Tax=Bacteroides faecichinchillae TaxID=871325 RepID=A0A1M5A0X3_9BACE|nr:hypothetical protein [Bacteroides faecichinchillae]THG68448.1 hypothetical protein E5981_04670 [Bacteroides faecichinchillae]SHF23777.1 hypothetical protein SAMN05444349_1148 [Bacteroides faecichinchillae]
MRIFGLIFLSIILCLSVGFVSCDDEQGGGLEQSSIDIASKAKVRSVSYIPECWDGKNQLPAPYEYQTSYWDHPYSSDVVDTCQYYFSFVYSWGTAYDLQYYDRLQLQYRFAPDKYEDYHDMERIPESEWHNIGEKYPKELYPGGIIKRKDSRCELNIDAHHLPKAKLNIRYRLLHCQYPGVWPSDTIYNKILFTEWRTVFLGYNVVDNIYGYTSTGYLYFHVNFPTDGREYTYSVFVDSEQLMNKENGVYTCKKNRKQGRYEISAMMHAVIGVNSIYKSGRIEGTYNENSSDIYVNFTPEHFQY